MCSTALAVVVYHVRRRYCSNEARWAGSSFARDRCDADGTVTTDYEYDDQGRLWKVSQGGALLNEYLYDPRGNRVSSDGVTTNAHYDVQDRLKDFDDSTYFFYSNGARSERKEGGSITGQYVYDALGNLSQFVKPGVVQVDYTVDALNRRITKKNNGAAVAAYIYGSGSRIAAVLDRTGNLAARFVYASHPNTPDYMVVADGTVYKFLCDQRGSPRLIVNSTTGAVAERIDYDAWGKATLSTTAAFASWQQPFGFAGGLYDDDTGLVRFGARGGEADGYRALTAGALNVLGYGLGEVIAEPVTPYANSLLAGAGVKEEYGKALEAAPFVGGGRHRERERREAVPEVSERPMHFLLPTRIGRPSRLLAYGMMPASVLLYVDYLKRHNFHSFWVVPGGICAGVFAAFLAQLLSTTCAEISTSRLRVWMWWRFGTPETVDLSRVQRVDAKRRPALLGRQYSLDLTFVDGTRTCLGPWVPLGLPWSRDGGVEALAVAVRDRAHANLVGQSGQVT